MQRFRVTTLLAGLGLLAFSSARAQTITPYQGCLMDLAVHCADWTESSNGAVLQACVNQHMLDCEGLRDSEKGEPNPLEDITVYSFCGVIRGYGVPCFN